MSTELTASSHSALVRAEGHPLHGRSTGDLSAFGELSEGVLRLRWHVPSFYPDRTKPPGDLYTGADFSMALRIAKLSPPPLAVMSRAFFERLDRLAPGTLSTIAVELQHDDGGPVLPYVAVTPTVVVESRDARKALATDLQWALLAFDPAAVSAPLFQVSSGARQRALVVSRAVAEAMDLGNWRDVACDPFLPSPVSGGLRTSATTG